MSKMKETAEGRADVPTVERQTGRTSTIVIAVLVVVVALLAGGLIGMALAGSDDDSTAYVAGGGDMTERQEEMLDLMAEYNEAMQVGDTDAVLDMFTSRGSVLWFGEFELVEDGSLAESLRISGPRPFAQTYPVLMDDYRALSFLYRAGGYYASVIEFTQIGELKIVRHVVGA